MPKTRLGILEYSALTLLGKSVSNFFEKGSHNRGHPVCYLLCPSVSQSYKKYKNARARFCDFFLQYIYILNILLFHIPIIKFLSSATNGCVRFVVICRNCWNSIYMQFHWLYVNKDDNVHKIEVLK